MWKVPSLRYETYILGPLHGICIYAWCIHLLWDRICILGSVGLCFSSTFWRYSHRTQTRVWSTRLGTFLGIHSLLSEDHPTRLDESPPFSQYSFHQTELWLYEVSNTLPMLAIWSCKFFYRIIWFVPALEGNPFHQWCSIQPCEECVLSQDIGLMVEAFRQRAAVPPFPFNYVPLHPFP